MRGWWMLAVVALVAAGCGGGGGGDRQPAPGEPGGPGQDYGWLDEPLPAPPLTAPEGRWLAADMHVHSDHSSDGSMWRQASSDALPGNVAVADQVGEAVRRGLDFLAITDHRTYDQHWDPLWNSDKLLLIPGEEANGRPHANVFGAHDTVLDGRDGPQDAAHRPTQQSIWDAHAQHAVWQSNHPDRDWTDDGTVPNAHASALGGDLIEVWNIAEDADRQLAYAESRWNRGFMTGISASSDSHFRELWAFGFGPGAVRTQVFAAARTERAILDGLRRGRTVLTRGQDNAAMLTLEADAQGDGIFEAIGGDAVPVMPGQEVVLRLRAQRASGHRLYLYAQPGREAGEIARFDPATGDQSFTWTLQAPDTPYWIYAELRDVGGRSALTAPIFLRPHAAAPAGELAVPEDLGPARDGARLLLGERGRYTGHPDVAQSGDTLLVVAERHDATGTDVLLRRGDSAPRVLNAVAGAARLPRVAAYGNRVWVAWEDERGGQQPRRPRIVLRGSEDGGASWGSETLLPGTARAIRPALAVLSDGRPVVAWSDNTRRCFDLFVQIGVDAQPQNLSSDKSCAGGNVFDTRSTRDPASLHPALAVLPDDTVVVVFQDNRYDVNPGWTGHTGFNGGFEGIDRTDPDNWEILARRRDPASGQWSDAVRVSNNGDPANAHDETALADRHPALAADAQGRLMAVWDAKVLSSSGVNSSIFASRSEDGGASWSAPELVAAEMEAMSQRPAVVADGDGFQLAWMDTRDTDWRHRIWGSRWSASGGWAAAQRLSGAGNAGWPRLAPRALVFASDRGADAQRDPTWRVLLRDFSAIALQAPAAAKLASDVMPVREDVPFAGVDDWRRRWLEEAARQPPPHCHH